MSRSFRLLCAVACSASLALSVAFAQTTSNTPATPPKLEPLPEIAGDSDLEPQVTITRREGETVEEARVNGKVVW